MSNSLQPHELQCARLPYPSLSPRVGSNSCPLSWWCYLSNHLILCLPLLLLPSISQSKKKKNLVFNQKTQNQGLFQWVGSFATGSQSIGASTSVLPINIQAWFPLGLTSSISLLSKGLSRIFSSTTVQNQFFGDQPSLWPNPYIYAWLLEKL